MHKASMTQPNFNSSQAIVQHTLQTVMLKRHNHKDPSQKIEFFTPTLIDSIPKDHRYNSMLNRKTMPGGKQLPKVVNTEVKQQTGGGLSNSQTNGQIQFSI